MWCQTSGFKGVVTQQAAGGTWLVTGLAQICSLYNGNHGECSCETFAIGIWEWIIVLMILLLDCPHCCVEDWPPFWFVLLYERPTKCFNEFLDQCWYVSFRQSFSTVTHRPIEHSTCIICISVFMSSTTGLLMSKRFIMYRYSRC